MNTQLITSFLTLTLINNHVFVHGLNFDYSINTNYNNKDINTIPKNFQGLAIEWNRMKENFAFDDFSINSKVVNIMSHFKQGRIAINGNSGSYAFLKESTLPYLPQYENSRKVEVTPEYFYLMNEIARKTNMKVIVGAPMLSENPDYTVEFIRDGILKYVEQRYLLSIEIGNEPDHFAIEKKKIRSKPYTYEDYFYEYKQILDALYTSNDVNNNELRVTGPAFAGCNTWPQARQKGHCWIDDFFTFAKNTPSYVHSIGYHRYGQSGCSSKTNVETLMRDPDPAEGHYKWLDDLVPQLKSINKELVWSEGNAFSCGGKDGQSNTYGVAIWAFDQLFENAVRGVQGGLIHSSYNKDYASFKVDKQNGDVSVQPLFYAQWLFAQILSNVKVRDDDDNDDIIAFRPDLNRQTSNYYSEELYIKSYALQNVDTGKINVVFFLKDPNYAGTSNNIDYSLSFVNNEYYKPASITRMQASGNSLYETKNININGQTFRNTKRGLPQGQRAEETVYPSNGVYNVQLKPLEVVVLAIEK
eukprot:Pgem_evm1s1003